ncbi:LacI family DNA-binding transcriptional regulator [Nakamurella endophytica]|uniref:Alanine racemase n=1 Tax=Nakamurella endophytica TaxID=1748367 RepID=A0A917WIV2_9ACTN|nr:LacI family DNA-binding transcriptional regulator [Nakamurella endophytica]GGM09200.1 alanine racemase [Nakamurella endophytica]
MTDARPDVDAGTAGPPAGGPPDGVRPDVTHPRPTLDSVAARAGVSRQTVSNVLNLPHLVRAETARRVSAAIAELGYRPHRAAQQLRTRRSRLLGLRVELSAGDKVFDRFLHALTEAADLRGYRVMLYTAGDDEAEIAAYTELRGRWDIDGVVLTTTHPGDRRTAHLAGAGLPCVTFGRPWDDSDHHPWVDVDGAAGTAEATRHLVGAGRRRIAFLGWPAGSAVGDDRLAGWAAAVAAAGLPAPEPGRSVNDPQEARRAADALLDTVRPDAVVCASDLLALGVLSALTARGRIAGRDVAVTGFDDTDIAALVGLSSVAQPLSEVASECARLVTELVEDPRRADTPERLLLAPRLVVRDSSSGPP